MLNFQNETYIKNGHSKQLYFKNRTTTRTVTYLMSTFKIILNIFAFKTIETHQHSCCRRIVSE